MSSDDHEQMEMGSASPAAPQDSATGGDKPQDEQRESGTGEMDSMPEEDEDEEQQEQDPSNPEDEEYRAQLEKETKEMAEKIESLKNDTKKKQAEYKEECEKLVDDQAEKAVSNKKLKKLYKAMEQNEEKIKKNKEKFNEEFNELEASIAHFHQEAAQHHEDLRELFEGFQEVVIGEQDHYGDMEKDKEAIQKQIEIIKSGVALGREELNQKQEKLKKLAKDCANIDSVEITPEVKKEIIADCSEAIKNHRKKLMEIKMKNHSNRISLQQLKMGRDTETPPNDE